MPVRVPVLLRGRNLLVAKVYRGQHLLEDERVEEYGHGHLAGLHPLVLLQHAGNGTGVGRRDVPRRRPYHGGGLLYARVKIPGRLVDQLHGRGNVFQRAMQVAALRKPLVFAALAAGAGGGVADSAAPRRRRRRRDPGPIAEPCLAKAASYLFRLVIFAEPGRYDHGQHGPDFFTVVGYLRRLLDRIPCQAARRLHLGLYDDWGLSLLRDQYVGDAAVAERAKQFWPCRPGVAHAVEYLCNVDVQRPLLVSHGIAPPPRAGRRPRRRPPHNLAVSPPRMAGRGTA